MIPSLHLRKLKNTSPETLSGPAEVHIPEIQRDSIATAENIMRVIGQERSERKTVSPGHILTVTETVETVPILLHPERVSPGFTSECATINLRTVTSYRQGRLARVLRSYDTAGQAPLSSTAYWHVRLGMAIGEPSKPGDMVEEILKVASPVIPDRGEAINLADAKGAASMSSFAGFVIQAAEALRAAGTTVELPANIAA
jgi:hypothetical protein